MIFSPDSPGPASEAVFGPTRPGASCKMGFAIQVGCSRLGHLSCRSRVNPRSGGSTHPQARRLRKRSKAQARVPGLNSHSQRAALQATFLNALVTPALIGSAVSVV